MKRMVQLCGLVLVSMASSVVAQQIDGNSAVGFPENGSFSGSDIESVQINNGNLHVEIPIWSYTGRGGVKSGVSFVYDSKGWELVQVETGNTFTNDIMPETGNTLQLAPVVLGSAPTVTYQNYGLGLKQTFNCNGTTIPYEYRYGFVLREPNGTKHYLVPDNTPLGVTSSPCVPNAAPMWTADGSGIVMNGSIYEKDGTQNFSEDTNGNYLSGNSDGSFTDTLGRTYYRDGSYLDPNGTRRYLTITNQTVTVSTHLCAGVATCGEYPATWTVPHIITLPNGLTYTIDYYQNAEGEISSITFPTGATVAYTYGQPDLAGQRVLTRTVTVGSQVAQWTYKYANIGTPITGAQPTTTVYDPVGNQTVYTCTRLGSGLALQGPSAVNQPCWITEANYSDPSGKLIKKVATSYPSNGGPVLPASVTTTWPATNQVSEVDMTYDSQSVEVGEFNNVVSRPFSWGNVTDKFEYDYGVGAHGPLLRHTHYDYLHLPSTDPNVSNPNWQQYQNRNIADKPVSKIVYDGSGNVMARTYYSYDGSTLTSTSNQAFNHDTNYGSTFIYRGNFTQESRWVNTSGNQQTLTKYSYDDLGNRITEEDPNGNTTNYSYQDNFADTNCAPTTINPSTASKTFAFLTQTTDALGHATKHGYYHCTGQLASTQDANDIAANRSGTTYTYDFMNRQASVSYPDGGLTTKSYSSSLPYSVTTTKTLSAGNSSVLTKVLDGLGRVTQTQLTSDPYGADKVDTTYDVLGRIYTVSNPYRNTSDTTYGLTTYLYDALGRTSSKTNQDNTSQQWQYPGNTVLFWDESNNEWQRTSDALGRLTKVLEPNGTSQSPSMETDYTYDANDNLKSVVQIGDGSGSRNRSFFYDNLSRLIATNNPENASTAHPASLTCPGITGSWTTCYGYDANSNLASKTDNRGVTTSYAYDPLNRPIHKIYSDGTPTAYFAYDGKDASGNALSVKNSVGRLSYSSNGVNAGSIYSYDPMGRTVDKWLCVPGDCTFDMLIQAAYYPDGSLSLLTNGVSNPGVSLYYGYDGAGRLDYITSSWEDATHPATLFSATSDGAYSAVGLQNASYGINASNNQATVSLTRGYDKRLHVVSESDAGFTLVPGTSGTAALTIGGPGAQVLDPCCATINGSEQSKTTPATQSSGQIDVSGSVQSIQVPTQGPTGSTGLITVDGFEKTYSSCPEPHHCTNIPAVGSVYLTVNGFQVMAYFGQGSDTSSLASALAAALNASGSPVTANASGANVAFSSRATGSSTNYPVSASWTTDPSGDGSAPPQTDFYIAPSGLNMAGGQDAQYKTVFDSGTASASVNGCTGSYNWGQNDSQSSIASGLASSLNANCGSFLASNASGNTISLISKSTGASTNWPVSSGTTHNSGQFSTSSFSISAGGMAGGQDAVTTYDQGTVTFLINNATKMTVNYGQNDNPQTIATAFANAINADGTMPITATTSGGTVNFVKKPNQNFTLAPNYTWDNANFPNHSFAPTVQGGIPDKGTVTLTINGTAESVDYSNGDYTRTVAAKLASAFSGNTSVTVTNPQNTATLNVTANSVGSTTDYSFSFSDSFTNSHFAVPSFTGSPAGGGLAGGSDPHLSTTPVPLYSYTIPSSGGYDGVGNLKSVNDSVMGVWNYNYDTLDRLSSGQATSGPYNGQYGCWTYDGFGNRTGEALSTTACTSSPPLLDWASYNTYNQVKSAEMETAGYSYDAAGNLIYDGVNTYLYDAENRLCAIQILNGNMTQYIYDGEGHRVAKGSISTFTCDLSKSGFSITNAYVVGPDGEQLSETDGKGHWDHTNIFANGSLLATYDDKDTYFALNDWLGTKRALNSASGCLSYWTNLPYGNKLSAATSSTCDDASEHHFTGKERDSESGNDYFGARYYASSTGRFLSPDWASNAVAVPYSDLGNPQSLNLYAYVRNNPLSRRDADGHLQQDAVMGKGWVDKDPCQTPPNCASVTAEQQNSSDGGGFWHHVRNLLHGHSWNYVRATVTVTETDTVRAPNEAVTAATDAVGLAGLAANQRVAKPLGRVGAAVSILNDPSPKNITTNVLGLLPGFDGPMAITGAFNDFLDWGVNNSTPDLKKAYGSDQLTPTPPTQDGGCLASGLPSC